MVGDGVGRHTPTLSGEKVTRALSVDGALLPYFGDAVGQLAESWQWVEMGDTIDDIVQACADAVAFFYGDFMVGSISSFLGSLPVGWLALDGSTYDQVDFPELSAQLDAQYKNDPAGTITLPDLSGLFPVFAGGGYSLGDMGGAVDVALSVAELPSHSHTYTFPVTGATIGGAGPPLPVVNAVTPSTPTSSVGNGDAHENMPPYAVLNYGIFSGRG